QTSGENQGAEEIGERRGARGPHDRAAQTLFQCARHRQGRDRASQGEEGARQTRGDQGPRMEASASAADEGSRMSADGLVQVALLVRDYDEAIAFFTEALGFSLIEDTPMSPSKRWVVLAPAKHGARLLLAKAVGAQQEAAIGNQFGGRVGFFLHTDD